MPFIEQTLKSFVGKYKMDKRFVVRTMYVFFKIRSLQALGRESGKVETYELEIKLLTVEG